MGHREEHTSGGLIELLASGTLFASGLVARYFLGMDLVSNILFISTMLISGLRIAESGFRALLHLNISINLLMTIAAIGAFAIGEHAEGAAVLFLFALAERLEDYAGDRARHAIESLMELKPEVARLRRNGEEVEVAVDDVLPGEVFVLRPGDRVPLDGVIIEGASSVNQAAITGESVPLAKLFGDEVYAGTINIDGFLAVKVTRMSEESVLAKILRMVEEAEERRSPTEAFVDRFSRYYTPAVIALSVAVAAVPPLLLMMPVDVWIYRALVMLVIACPCALAISTPVAMVSAIASAGRNGVLIKGSTYVEKMSRTRAVAFDKTGTLTRGELGVTDVVSNGAPEREILRKALSLEARSEHPIARAIVERARADGLEISEVTEFKAHVGRGVEACIGEKTCCVGSLRLFQELGIPPMDGMVEKLESEGKTVVLVSEENCVIGVIALMDKIREDSREALAEIKRRGIKAVMLTGDNDNTARAIADKLGMDEYLAQLLPDEKVEAIDKIREKYGSVAMVGDGVNDAPALAAADVGIAMGAIGSDVALETADVALMKDELSRLPYLVSLSRSTMGRIRENISASILVKSSFAVLGVLGLISLWEAVAIGDMGLSLAVILNSLRLSRIRA